MINPLGLKGQIHGGVAQGLGQVLMEQVVYDPDSGQLLSGSFMDYAMPRADTTCDVAVVSNAVPTALNPLGAKGAGEAGTVGASAGRDERRAGRAGAAWCARARHAGHQRTRMARDRGGPATGGLRLPQYILMHRGKGHR